MPLKMLRLLLVGLLTSLWACSSSTPPASTPVSVVYLRSDNPPYRRADDDAFADYVLAHPLVKIVDHTTTYPLQTSLLVGNLKADNLDADLVRVPPSWVCGFADNVVDVPEDIITLERARTTFFAAPLAGSTCGGKLKGLPIEYNLEYGGVVLNLDKYQARFPGKTPAWTDWDAFITEAASLTEYDDMNKPRANGLDIAPEWPQPFKHIFFSQIVQRGGSYWSADGKSFDFSTHAAYDALTEMVSWLTVKKVMYPSLVPPNDTFVTNRLIGGATGYGWNDLSRPLSVMGYAGSWALANTRGQLPSGNHTRYGYYALPPMVGAEHRFVQNSGFAFVVPRTSKNQKAAWDVARAIALDPEGARRWSAIGGALPALRVNGSAAAAAGDPILAQVQPLLEKGNWVGYIPVEAIETIEGTMVSDFFAAVKGTMNVTQALADMQQKANDLLARYR
jgi:multiple sugar transport system substrate-binding protein